MLPADLLRTRMINSGLAGPRFRTPAQAVAYLGAVQAQDFPMAKWSLGLRVKGSSNETVEEAYNKGRILRTHILRPTWHFVVPENIHWMLKLTSPKVKSVLAPYNRKLDLDEKLFGKSNRIIVRALSDRGCLTRAELKEELAIAGVRTNVQRLGHIVAWAELDGLICSGPLRDNKVTYALLKDRVPTASAPVSREEALANLAATYFKSHGPAQEKDFAWWSGLPMADARSSIQSLGSKLRNEIVGDKKYFFVPVRKGTLARHPRALLLSVYDEYTIAYKDRTDLSERVNVQKLLMMGSALTSVIILDGKVAGAWRKITKNAKCEIVLKPFRRFNELERKAVTTEAVRYGKFFQMSPVLRFR